MIIALLQVDSIDNETLTRLSSNAKQQLSHIQKNYRDTMSQEFALFLGAYKHTYRNMEKLMNKAGKTQKEVEISIAQLKNLKADLENGLLDKDLAQKYVQKEDSIVNYLSGKTAEWPKASERYIQEYHSSVAQVDSVLEYMKINGMR